MQEDKIRLKLQRVPISTCEVSIGGWKVPISTNCRISPDTFFFK